MTKLYKFFYIVILWLNDKICNKISKFLNNIISIAIILEFFSRNLKNLDIDILTTQKLKEINKIRYYYWLFFQNIIYKQYNIKYNINPYIIYYKCI